MTLGSCFHRSITFAGLGLAAAIFLSVSGASPARADRCDDLAAQLKGQIDGLAVGRTAANVIYLSHPQAKQITLGCSGRNVTNQLFAESRQPQAAAGLSQSGGQRRRHHLHAAEGRHAEGRDALHQADGPVSRRRRRDTLPSPRHALLQDQNRGFDHDFARGRRVSAAAVRPGSRGSGEIEASRSPSRPDRPRSRAF